MQRAFIFGNPRSGTSLLRLMLNAHPLIISPPESGFLQWWYKKYKRWSIRDSMSQQYVEQYVEDVLSSRKIETWNLSKKALFSYILDKKPNSYAEIGESVYLIYAQKKGKDPSVIIDKNNYYIHHLNSLKEIWPDAKFIHLIRDGRDVACSYMGVKDLKTKSDYKPQLPYDIKDIAREWVINNQNIMKFGSTQKEGNFVSIRYEDLLNNVESTLSKLLKLFGLNFDERMLEYYKINDEPSSTLDWKRKTLSSIDQSNTGKFTKLLNKSEIRSFEDIASEMLKKFDYL